MDRQLGNLDSKISVSVSKFLDFKPGFCHKMGLRLI